MMGLGLPLGLMRCWSPGNPFSTATGVFISSTFQAPGGTYYATLTTASSDCALGGANILRGQPSQQRASGARSCLLYISLTSTLSLVSKPPRNLADRCHCKNRQMTVADHESMIVQ
ncbi:hypothetical protein BV25DRAFT_1825222 [Artomyces pyxidatus]|uniref:Uncharacterized protein n=1 Tax=Artomyces pyxidatus TaxID=48021 RepID=A0ACB8T3Y9_9AGAM|nr:hypothetical protein BV25DRAFT_1825222 [Artomyces pyxidatus]